MSITKTKNEIEIKDSLTKFDVVEYREQLTKWLNDDEAIVLKLEFVKECDTAGLQMLFSLKKSVENTNNAFSIKSASEAVKDTAQKLGMDLNELKISEV